MERRFAAGQSVFDRCPAGLGELQRELKAPLSVDDALALVKSLVIAAGSSVRAKGEPHVPIDAGRDAVIMVVRSILQEKGILAYNLTRVMNIVGVKPLITAMRP